LLGPVFVWSLIPFSWYRLHRELASYAHCMKFATLRYPILAIIPPLSLAGVAIIAYIWMNNTPSVASFAAASPISVGFIGMPISLYRMGRNIAQLRRGAAHRDWNARVTGMVTMMLVVVPFAAIPYFRYSLNQIAHHIPTPSPPPPMAADIGHRVG